MKNEDVVGAAPTGDAPTTSEWSTIQLPTKVRLILETWRYIQYISNTVKPLSFINTLRLRQKFGHFANIFKCIFLNENVWISIKISLKFVPKGPINNHYHAAFVQIMAWRRTDHKPLSEPMMVSLPMHIWVTQSQWVKLSISGISIQEKFTEISVFNHFISWETVF